MYRAKEDGRNRYRFFTAEFNRQARTVLDIEIQLRRALEEREFALFYQAVLNPATGAEALLRWPRLEHGFVAPRTFIPIAETTGLIQPLGAWVFEEVARQQREWQDAGLPALPIAVNVSPLQLRHQEFLPSLERALSNGGMRPQALTLEVPESALANNADENERVLRPLKDLGLRIALGNLGIGSASLSRLPIDTLKLDHSFVRRFPDDHSLPALVDMIIAMGCTLRMAVVAEGIETEQAFEFVRDHGCDQAQGFHLCAPMPGREFGNWYRQRLT